MSIPARGFYTPAQIIWYKIKPDPRYTGNPDGVIWNTWEYHVLTESGSGNLVRPEHAI